MIKELTTALLANKDLSAKQMQAAMEEIMSGSAVTEEVVSFLIALSNKKETAEELAAAAQVLRKYAVRVKTKHKVVLDTCGTGGDNRMTFNISTAAAFVAAGAGISVAKHGNRSVSSKTGSADVLEALGININMPVEALEKCLDDIGIAFLFAQNLHPAMKYAMPARKQIGRRTMFNILGPLSNPAASRHQLVGVYDQALTKTLAEVLAKLGTTHALVVAGKDGLDEITTTAPTVVSETHDGKVRTYEINPEDFGIKKAGLKDLLGGSAQDNAGIITGILDGRRGAQRDIVLFNAAAAIFAADKAPSIKKGLELAEESLDSFKARRKLELLQEASRE